MLAILAVVAVYVALAYLLVPAIWSWRLGDAPRDPHMLTVTEQGIPGDPINIGLVGERRDILHAFTAAGWSPADAVTLRSSLEIGESVILDRPYADAPVSPLFFDGRRQDLAFEKADGTSADRRNHIRLWRTAQTGADGRSLWL